MNHAITVGDLVAYVLIAGGIMGLCFLIGYVVLVLLNPFSSGH